MRLIETKSLWVAELKQKPLDQQQQTWYNSNIDLEEYNAKRVRYKQESKREILSVSAVLGQRKVSRNDVGIFVLGEKDGHCAFQILPQLVTELRDINNRPIPFSEEPLEAVKVKEPWDED